MSRPLIIVESPAKARTIARFLGDEFDVASSVGHIRDLPGSAAEIPARYKDQPWARLGVNVEEGFEPLYVVPRTKSKVVKELRSKLKDASELYLATDEDREGESIAWHLREVLKPKVPVRRMVFHEITPQAIRQALERPRDIDEDLVEAQEARRILDRLFGYEVSPVLWKMIRPKLSAGRVQSVAVRLVVERERERMAFTPAEYWDIEGSFAPTAHPDDRFVAGLVEVEGSRVATGKDFDASGRPTSDVLVLDEKAATELATDLAAGQAEVASVERKPYTRRPYAPFRTSTLQQEAGRRLRFSAARTMSAAQRLYENGYITYMRTDSTTLSEEALAEARRQVARRFGSEYVQPRTYTSKVRNAQEAHEAIRPAGETWRDPEEVAKEVGPDEAKLYDLIWRRTLASQMADAKGETVKVTIAVTGRSGRDATFAASGTTITFPGFLKVYEVRTPDTDTDAAGDTPDERRIPALSEGETLDVLAMEPKGHVTKPPARYTEASLIKTLEELGVGRPSTYASIISTIQDRGYVWKKGSALIPSWTAFATVNLLERHFPELVDYAFTARMEEDLDEIAAGEQEPEPWLASFYFGNGHPGLKRLVSEHMGDIDPREVSTIPIGVDPDTGEEIVVRVGRYGPYLQRGDDKANIPEHIPPDELTVEKAKEILEAPSGDKILGTDPDTGLTVYVRRGRYGPYVQLGEVEDGAAKPKTASLFKTMTPDDISLEQALLLLQLPRVVGVDPETGEEIVALNGRYGPYLKRGSETRSLESEDQLFTVTLEEAIRLFKEPKKGRRGRSAAPLKELGEDPDTGRKIVVRSGRYGPYVTDGEVNASLRKGDDPESITLERAVELIRERKAKLEG